MAAKEACHIPEGLKGVIKDLDNWPVIQSWSKAGRGSGNATELGTGHMVDYPVLDLAPLPSGGLVWCSGGSRLGLPGRDAPPGRQSRFRDMDLDVDRSGDHISFRYTLRGDAYTSRSPARSRAGPRPASAARGPRTCPILWDQAWTPYLDGKPLVLEPNERSRAVAIAPAKDRFLLGTTSSLRCFDAHGAPLWTRPAQESVYAVNITGDGALGVAAY